VHRIQLHYLKLKLHRPIILMQTTSGIIKREIRGLCRGYQFQVAGERSAISKLFWNAHKK
jgi:hypothetical protein